MSAVSNLLTGAGDTADAYMQGSMLQGQSLQDAIAALEQNFGQTQQQFNPFINIGSQAFKQQAALSGALGAKKQAKAYQNFNMSPGQQFLQQQAEKALLRNAASTGQLGGGRTQQALQEQAIGLAQQNYQNHFNQLGGISGSGIGLLSQLGSLQGQLGGNVANMTAGIGQAQQQGLVGAAQAQQQGMTDLLGLGAMGAGTYLGM